MSVGRIALVCGLVIVAFAIASVWIFPPGSSALDGEFTEVTDTGVLKNMVQITRSGIATSENYVGHKIRLIRGTLKNVSDKPIRLIELKLQFTDYKGATIHEGIHAAFQPKQRPLDPGTEYRFELAFENLPRSWNYRVPSMQVVRVAY